MFCILYFNKCLDFLSTFGCYTKFQYFSYPLLFLLTLSRRGSLGGSLVTSYHGQGDNRPEHIPLGKNGCGAGIDFAVFIGIADTRSQFVHQSDFLLRPSTPIIEEIRRPPFKIKLSLYRDNDSRSRIRSNRNICSTSWGFNCFSLAIFRMAPFNCSSVFNRISPNSTLPYRFGFFLQCQISFRSSVIFWHYFLI
ncbi:Uncharacterised protein [Acetobacterium wieringae]|nr:Uncharacterised protein [Acetobacterium wieringae]